MTQRSNYTHLILTILGRRESIDKELMKLIDDVEDVIKWLKYQGNDENEFYVNFDEILSEIPSNFLDSTHLPSAIADAKKRLNEFKNELMTHQKPGGISFERWKEDVEEW